MFCPNCGRDNGDGGKFCSFCGEPLPGSENLTAPSDNETQNYVPEDASQANTTQENPSQANTTQETASQGNPYQETASQGNFSGTDSTGYQNSQSGTPLQNLGDSGNGEQNIIVTVACFIFAALYGYRGLRMLFSIFQAFFSLLHFYTIGDTLVQILFLVSSVLTFATCLALCLVLVVLALCRNKENRESLLYGLAACGILRIAASLIHIIIYSLYTLTFWHRIWLGTFLQGLFQTVVYALVTVGCILLLSIVTNEYTFVAKSADEIKELLMKLPQIFQDAVSFLKSKAKQGQTGSYGTQTTTASYSDNTAGYNSQTAQQAIVPPVSNNNYNNANNYSSAGSYSEPRPAFRMNTDRSLLLYIILSICTCGIYAYYFLYTMARDANTICEGDGQKTGGLIAFILLSFITCGFYAIYWEYSLGNRLAENAPRYGLMFSETGASVLMWYIFGIFICGIGPFVSMHILIKNMNRLSAAYNSRYGL